jgi:uncharacterized protein
VFRERARIIEESLQTSVRSSSVVVLEGGRAVGKSTVCDRLSKQRGWAPRIDLSNEDALAHLRLDPARFLRAQPTPCILDEAQLEPQLPLWIKSVVDERRSPGQFVLTGSARLGRNQLGGSDPLVGRAVRHTMWSMTRGELEGGPTDFVERAFGEGWKSGMTVKTSARDPWVGGLPGMSGVLIAASSAQWERELSAYVEGVLPLGAGNSRVDLGRLLRTFRYLAANSGQLLNFSRAASELGMQANTVRAHLEILEASFLLFRAEAERPSEHRVVVAHPRVFATDVGLATWAARAWAKPMSAVLLGSLTETLVAHDLCALAHAHRDRIVVRHWRDERNRSEVDLLLVHPDGRHVAIEVKASTSAGPDDTRGLRAFASAFPESCVHALLVYEGNTVKDLSSPESKRTSILAIPRALL